MYPYLWGVRVGGGSAGSVVAARLAKSGKNSVLLIEAGPDCSSRLLNIPVLSPLLLGSKLDWSYKTQPQFDACLGLDNNASVWPRGKVLGGSSRINNIVYMRGHSRDFDSWGDSSWSHQEVHNYFPHRTTNGNVSESDLLRGFLPVNELPWTTALSGAMLRAGEQLGYTMADLNAVLLSDKYEAYGVQYRRFGHVGRVRARKAVILCAGTVGSSKILMLSGMGPKHHLQSLKIPLIQDLPVGQNLQDHVTTGLDIVILNQTLPLNVANIASLSSAFDYLFYGTGPWTSPGCEAVAVVHSDLSDPQTDPPDLQLMAIPSGASSDDGAHLYTTVGITDKVWQGYFSTLSGKQVASFLPVLLHPKSKGEILLRDGDPNSLPLINPRYLTHQRDVDTLYRVILNRLSDVARLDRLQESNTCPASRRKKRVPSPAARSIRALRYCSRRNSFLPLLCFSYLPSPSILPPLWELYFVYIHLRRERKVTYYPTFLGIRGILLIKKIISTPAMQSLGASLNPNIMPGCEQFLFDSGDYWKCYIRHLTLTAYHPVGTCKMGPISDPSSVVDFDLRVHNSHHLYVIDASIMPSLPSGNINAAVVMIAEKGVEIVERYWAHQAMVCHKREVFLPSKVSLKSSSTLAQVAPPTLSTAWTTPQSMFSEPYVTISPLYSAPMRTPLSIGSLGGHYHSRFPAPMGSSLFSY
uniref:Glucose-methanol-choline oxidoreductase N-terminal domain-containing protein n=1 Tax=Timema monikensis TaxID=170555 RepID=A0A7R9HRR0_9NEOP|nr:unnamed protein product [Timema monikensis]